MSALSVDDLVADLGRLGVRAGDTVMVHASLRAIGPVVGGADGVLDAIGAVLGPDGTMMMVLGADDEVVPFDHLTTPADPDVGVLAEVFRQRLGTKVSNNPEGRFGAAGAGADLLLTDAPWDDYYGPDSPLERFIGHGGKVLRVGADLDTVTLIHYAEYVTPVEPKRRVVRRRVVIDPDGGPPLERTVACLDDSDGIVEYPGPDYFEVILREYLDTGRASTGTVGGARSELIDGADLVRFAVAWMTERFGALTRPE